MALLALTTRRKYFAELGYGAYTKENIKKLQKKYFIRSKDIDGIYGNNTDILLRHVYNVSKTKNFSPEEFRCECGGKYCTGYPTWMKMHQLNHLQTIRSHYNKPMTVTCGLRCKKYNAALSGSIVNSKHITGYATDFYMPGVTDSLATRKSAIKYITTLKNHT